MPALVQLQARDGAVLFEGEFSSAELQEIGIRDKVEDVVKATGTRVSALAATIRECTVDLLDEFDALAAEKRAGGAFSTATMEFGITVTGEGNVVVARGSVEANIKVTLTWDFS
jgi:Trypsin-co-occurring domain 1